MKISDFGRDIDQALASLREVLPDDLQIERTSNEPEIIREKIGDFNRNLIEAVVIVILVALLFMEWRMRLLVAFSIPLTVAMTLGLCHLVGVDLQQVSIAALIIALGLLVDDPVVAGDAINRELAHGQPRDVAAWLGPQKLARAILFATLTNCVAFLPLLLVTGKTGEFIWSLPVVVTASLVASRIVSMTFMPLLGYYVLKGQKGLGGRADRGRPRGHVRPLLQRLLGMVPGPQGDQPGRVPADPGRLPGLPAAGRHGVLSQGPAFGLHGQRLPSRRGADPPDGGGSAARSSPRSTRWKAARSAPTRRSSARAGRGSGCRSSPNSGPTTTPRSWSIRPDGEVTAERRPPAETEPARPVPGARDDRAAGDRPAGRRPGPDPAVRPRQCRGTPQRWPPRPRTCSVPFPARTTSTTTGTRRCCRSR